MTNSVDPDQTAPGSALLHMTNCPIFIINKSLNSFTPSGALTENSLYCLSFVWISTILMVSHKLSGALVLETKMNAIEDVQAFKCPSTK